MTNGKVETELNLPSQSKHGVIMKTSAFLDLQTKQTSWCVANKTITGEWKILECKTELYGGDDPYVESVVYKDGMMSYGQVIQMLVEYEHIRKGSGMFESVADYTTVTDIPSYKDVAHADGIIFDIDGNPHPTNHGALLTPGKFATSEIRAVLKSVAETDDQPHGSSLSRTFLEAHNRNDAGAAQVVQEKESQLKNEAMVLREANEITYFSQFLCVLHATMKQLFLARRVRYNYKTNSFFQRLRDINGNHLERIFSKKAKPIDVEMFADHYFFSWKSTDDGFNAILKFIETNRAFTGSLKEETKDFLCCLRLMMSSAIIHAVCDGKKELEIYGHSAELENIKEWNFIKNFICNHERGLMATEIKRHFPTMSKKDRAQYLDNLYAAALSDDFEQKYAEMKKFGEDLIGRVKVAAEKCKEQTPLTRKTAPALKPA